MKSQFAQNRAARWMAHVRQWGESGLAKSRHCRENGLALSTFQYWITKSGPSSGSESALNACVAQKGQALRGTSSSGKSLRVLLTLVLTG